MQKNKNMALINALKTATAKVNQIKVEDLIKLYTNEDKNKKIILK